MSEEKEVTEFEKMLEAFKNNGNIPEDVDVGQIMSQLRKQEIERTREVLRTVEKNTQEYRNFINRIVADAQSKNLEDGFWEGAVKYYGKDVSFNSPLERTKFELRELQTMLSKINRIIGFYLS